MNPGHIAEEHKEMYYASLFLLISQRIPFKYGKISPQRGALAKKQALRILH